MSDVSLTNNSHELYVACPLPEVNVSPSEENVWLTQEQIGILFETARSSISYHINNIFKNGELEEGTSVEFFDRSQTHRPSKYYNLDVILSVGYISENKVDNQ